MDEIMLSRPAADLLVTVVEQFDGQTLKLFGIFRQFETNVFLEIVFVRFVIHRLEQLRGDQSWRQDFKQRY